MIRFVRKLIFRRSERRERERERERCRFFMRLTFGDRILCDDVMLLAAVFENFDGRINTSMYQRKDTENKKCTSL